MEAPIEVPIAYCEKCDAQVPVVLLNYEYEELTVPSVICPVCDSFLNAEGDIKVEWYPVQEVSTVTNFVLKDILDAE